MGREIADHCEGVKLVLVALKCDLRNNEDIEDQQQSNPYSSQRD